MFTPSIKPLSDLIGWFVSRGPDRVIRLADSRTTADLTGPSSSNGYIISFGLAPFYMGSTGTLRQYANRLPTAFSYFKSEPGPASDQAQKTKTCLTKPKK